MDSPISALTSGRGKDTVYWTEFSNKWEKYDWTLPRLMDFSGVTFLVYESIDQDQEFVGDVI